MPKQTRTPGQPLLERPHLDSHVQQTLNRTLFREPTLARRQNQAQVQRRGTLVQRAVQRPHVSIFTESDSDIFPLVHTPSFTVSPEDAFAVRGSGVGSPVSPLTPEVLSQEHSPKPSQEQVNYTLGIEPATPASELEPCGAAMYTHWYFDQQAANHYDEKHVSMSDRSAFTMMSGGLERRRRGVRVSVKRVRTWIRGKAEQKERERVERRQEKKGELVVKERVLVCEEKERCEKGKGVKGKLGAVLKRGTDRLRKLVPGGKKAMGEKKEEWRVLDRITGFQTIE
ncbi:uncharacterized protein EAE97_009492 [Botrytis byssoidea]|uniref:Uncharacterized protein n=1 Tax=Botrytis byssoidea TaxID=139641 RepID=A0A9P5I2E3_9HELO|nr:uncharacterized protein EAE97_009492 [Botrytis byssoidea]KAF7929895.1 hypothetical protein EAE97_009492 [Botrytis byssoidea]